MRAALYLRQSLDRSGDGLAVERQRIECQALAAQRGWETTAYVDNDTSASGRAPRPAYTRMLAAIESGEVGAVVVWDLDRLHRQPIELEQFIDLADRRRVALATVTGEVDLGTDNGRLYARIKGAVARAEVERKGARQRAQVAQAASAGRPVSGRRPFGFEADRMTVRVSEAALIRSAYVDVLDGVPLARITQSWRDSGIQPSQGGAPWARNSVRQVLLNPRNAGLRAHRGEVVGPAAWPALVDEPQWRAACAVLTDPSRRTSPTTARRWLLSGLAECGLCGGPMAIGWSSDAKKGTRHRKYVCRNLRHVTRSADLAEAVVRGAILARLAQADARSLLVDDTRPDAAALSAEADVLRRRLDDLAAAFADGVITISQMRTGTEKIRATLSEVEQRMVSVDRAPLLADLLNAEDVAAHWERLGLDRQRAVVRLLLQVVVHPSPVGHRPEPESVKVGWRAA